MKHLILLICPRECPDHVIYNQDTECKVRSSVSFSHFLISWLPCNTNGNIFTTMSSSVIYYIAVKNACSVLLHSGFKHVGMWTLITRSAREVCIRTQASKHTHHMCAKCQCAHCWQVRVCERFSVVCIQCTLTGTLVSRPYIFKYTRYYDSGQLDIIGWIFCWLSGRLTIF